MAVIKDAQLEALPITMVGGKIIKKGAYPTFDEIASAQAE